MARGKMDVATRLERQEKKILKMAEELERERSLYLKELKASMTKNELQNMVRETIAFNEWNTTELQNNDFISLLNGR